MVPACGVGQNPSTWHLTAARKESLHVRPALRIAPDRRSESSAQVPNSNQGDAYPVIQHGNCLPHFLSLPTPKAPCSGVFPPRLTVRFLIL